MSDNYNLKIDDFLSRYRVTRKIDDLFSRGYTLATDSHTNRRVIIKLYSIQTPEQEQAVLENLQNFAKLNQIPGISKLISFAIAQNGNELMSAFEFDHLTLGEFVQIMKQSRTNRSERLVTYLQILGEICKIVSTSIQIGIEFDDINRETILIKQTNPYIQSSSSFGQQPQQHYSITFFYDERQKQYTKIENNILTLQNNNKLYWSPQKIQNQILKNSDFNTQEGQQSIYQLGLMILDIIYQVEKFMQKNDSGTDYKRASQQLKPDDVVLHSESMMSYYQIFQDKKMVVRNQPLITQRLNYLIGFEDDCFKQMGLLLKNMIILMSQARPNIQMILLQKAKVIQSVKSQPQKPICLSNSSQKIQHTNNVASFRSLQSITQQPIQSSLGQTIKNIQYSRNNLSSNTQININSNINMGQDYDSLKYSENSLGNTNQIFQLTNQTIKKYNLPLYDTQSGQAGSSPNYRPIDLKSATTVTSEAINNKLVGGTSGYDMIRNPIYQSPNSNSIKNQSPVLNSGVKNTRSFQQNPNGFIKTGEILQHCKLHHERLVSSLMSAINQLQQIKKVHSEKVLKKQYFDGSVYYGCFDQLTKKKKGLGIYLYNTGDIYFGNWDENLLINGTYLFKNGESFEGTVKAGKQGLGVYRYSNGNVYEGMWKDDLKNGKGIMTYPNGAKYDGQWLKGKKHGEGMYYYENGTKYIGGFALGKKYGHGIFVFSNGTKIQGFWDNNHLEGLAKIYYQNGDYYEGNFHMSQKSGEGLYRWNSQQQGQVQYKGSFKKDNLDGFAIIRFSNGQIYEGKVKNGKRDGEGIYKYSNGDQFKGEWKNDQKQIGKYVFSTGDHFQGRFKQGQMSFGLMKYLNGQTYQGEFYRGERHGVGAYSNKVGQLVYEGHWERDQYRGSKKN